MWLLIRKKNCRRNIFPDCLCDCCNYYQPKVYNFVVAFGYTSSRAEHTESTMKQNTVLKMNSLFDESFLASIEV